MVSGVIVAVVAPDFFSKFFSTFSPAVPTALRSLIGGGALWRRALRARVPLGWGLGAGVDGVGTRRAGGEREGREADVGEAREDGMERGIRRYRGCVGGK
jgi:hypothetical protein